VLVGAQGVAHLLLPLVMPVRIAKLIYWYCLKSRQLRNETKRVEATRIRFAARAGRRRSIPPTDNFLVVTITISDYDRQCRMYAKTGGSTAIDDLTGHLILAVRVLVLVIPPLRYKNHLLNDVAGSGIF